MILTSGMYGFRKDAIDKFTYTRRNGGVDELGKAVLQFCCRNFAMDLIFDRIEQVDKYKKPTKKQAAEYIAAGYADKPLTVSDLKYSCWEDLLLETDLDKLAFMALTRGKVYMTDWNDYILSGLFHYAYIINLDTGNLEIWVGGIRKPQPGSRYQIMKNNGCFPHLVIKIPVKDIVAGGPSSIAGFIKQINESVKQYCVKHRAEQI